jgi:hypothetical protein
MVLTDVNCMILSHAVNAIVDNGDQDGVNDLLRYPFH